MREDVKATRLRRLSELRADRFGGSSAALAAAIKRSPSQVSQWFTGVRTITEDSARHIEHALRLVNGWLDNATETAASCGGTHDDDGKIPGNGQPETLRPYPSGKRIPVVGSAQLGDNGHFVELEYPVGHGDGWVDVLSTDPNAYALRCRGDSMRPRIRDGEYIVAEPNREVAPGDQVVVKARDGRVMVKTFLYRRDGRIHLQSVNEAHPSIALRPEDIEAMHCVTNITTRYVTE